MWLGSSQQLAKLDISHVRVLSSCVKVQDTARDLGVVIDSQLSLSAHVTAVCRSGYYQLRQAVRSLSEDASKTLVQAFVSCRLDYCNSLFFDRHLWRTDEPAAVGPERRRPSGYWHPTLRPHIAGAPSATLATGTPARRLQGGHTRTPVAVWHFTTVPGRRLPSCCRCSWAATAFHSEPNMRCVVTRTYSTFGDRAFGAAGPGLWNSLPSHLKDADISYSEFRQSLKTFLFG